MKRIPTICKSNDIQSISNFHKDGSLDCVFHTVGDIYDYLKERKSNLSDIENINEKKFVEIVDLIVSENIAEDKINIALDLFGIDNKRESNYWIILMSLLKETVDLDEYVKWWTEGMSEDRKHGDQALDFITITDMNNSRYIIKTVGDLYGFIGANK